MFENKIRQTALCDYLTRSFCKGVNALDSNGYDSLSGGGGGGGNWNGPKGGTIRMETPGQHVLERSSVQIIQHKSNKIGSGSTGSGGTDSYYIEVRFLLSLPARGRSIEGRRAADLLFKTLPNLLEYSLLYPRICGSMLGAVDTSVPAYQGLNRLYYHIFNIEDQEYCRSHALKQAGLVGFVANKSVLPRLSGASDLPPTKASVGSGVVPFLSPLTLHGTLSGLPHRGNVDGMCIKEGITLIVGGGFHGKSTILNALEKGVYNHIPGDGREFVCVREESVKIRAEDGRAVTDLDISPFINNLPSSSPLKAVEDMDSSKKRAKVSIVALSQSSTQCTQRFSTSCASGSTSQSANIIEMLEVCRSRCIRLMFKG